MPSEFGATRSSVRLFVFANWSESDALTSPDCLSAPLT
ncbi:hypothetical protein Ga0080559_TMP532 [Salipiger profundus]|uniref:Uncharacterized protein n=1 Tax=Salipiger profundus TaxID=1229727 RepID=A0A1U7CZP0_9RHOB|nr:hypothetical protein Ga0080559_TMP532 [Salipiger profundus]